MSFSLRKKLQIFKEEIDDVVKEGNLAAIIAQKTSLMREMAVETAKQVVTDKEVKDYTLVQLKLITKQA